MPSIILTMVKGPNPGQTITISTPAQIIGRSSVSNIIIDEPSISRQHARIALTESGIMIEDLGSANGTLVNGQRISKFKSTILQIGDTIQLGNKIRLKVQSAKTNEDEPVFVDEMELSPDQKSLADIPTMVPFWTATPSASNVKIEPIHVPASDTHASPTKSASFPSMAMDGIGSSYNLLDFRRGIGICFIKFILILRKRGNETNF